MVALKKAKIARADKAQAATAAFLETLNAGSLSFGQLLGALRESDEQTLSQFAARLGVSRQHLHQLETGQKRVSPERAVRFARALGYSEICFVQLALQDLINDAGIVGKVEIRLPHEAA